MPDEAISLVPEIASAKDASHLYLWFWRRQ